MLWSCISIDCQQKQLKWEVCIFGKNPFTVEEHWEEKIYSSSQDIYGWVIDILKRTLRQSITLKLWQLMFFHIQYVQQPTHAGARMKVWKNYKGDTTFFTVMCKWNKSCCQWFIWTFSSNRVGSLKTLTSFLMCPLCCSGLKLWWSVFDNSIQTQTLDLRRRQLKISFIWYFFKVWNIFLSKETADQLCFLNSAREETKALIIQN